MLIDKLTYPIFFCKVQGRIISQVKPTKSRPRPKPKEKHFKIDAPVKFEPCGNIPISKRLITLRDKYTYSKDDQIVFDNIHKIKQLGSTKIRE
jgi:hypothetical protein